MCLPQQSKNDLHVIARSKALCALTMFVPFSLVVRTTGGGSIVITFISRRNFLRTVGAGTVGGALAAHGAPFAVAQEPASTRFARLFPHLQPFAKPGTPLTAALLDIGRRGGIMDANDNLTAGPVALIVDP